MTNRSKQRGTTFESAVVSYLKERGLTYAERRALAGNTDKGDITGIGPRWVLELKAAKKIELAEWSKETAQERENAKADYGALVIKRERRAISDAYVVLPLSEFVSLVLEVES